jgi:hypothetical protein
MRDAMNYSISITLMIADFAASGSDHPLSVRRRTIGANHNQELRRLGSTSSRCWLIPEPSLQPPTSTRGVRTNCGSRPEALLREATTDSNWACLC